MNNNTILVATLALIIGGASAYLIIDRSSNYRNTPVGMHRMSDGTLMNNTPNTGMGGMMGNMDHGMMMVSSEKEFITEMIPHHQEAVDTAKEVLARGATTPEIKSLMENIVSAQEKEIADMKTWYEAWYGTPYQPSGNYKPMMRDLEGLNGKEIDKVFLEDMVMHHMGAIMMAHSVQAYIEHDEIKILTKAIIDSQSAEIELMRRLRAGL
jgi:uncharacterized protein (DUF305 family)